MVMLFFPTTIYATSHGSAANPNPISDPANPVSSSSPIETLKNPLGSIGVDNIPSLIEKILELVVVIGAPVVALFIIWSGFLFVSAQGNPEKIKTARTTLMYTLIGAALVLGATVIAKAIGGTIAQF